MAMNEREQEAADTRYYDQQARAGMIDGLQAACPHDSSSGVDQNFGPDKVWRCEMCGWLFRQVVDDNGITHYEEAS